MSNPTAISLVVGGVDELSSPIGRAEAATNRLGLAFERLERREPTMVLRRSALAMESLAASSLGMAGPLGRLAATAPLLFGTTGFLAVGVIGAVGGAFKALADHTAAFGAALDKLGDSMERAQLGPRADLAGRLGEMRKQMGELTKPGFLERAFTGVNQFLTGGIMAPVTQGLGVTTVFGQAAQGEAAARGIERSRQQQVIDALVAENQLKLVAARNQELLRVVDLRLGIEKLSLGIHPTADQLLNLTTQQKLYANALSNLDPITKATINTLIGLEAQETRRNARLREQEMALATSLASGLQLPFDLGRMIVRHPLEPTFAPPRFGAPPPLPSAVPTIGPPAPRGFPTFGAAPQLFRPEDPFKNLEQILERLRTPIQRLQDEEALLGRARDAGLISAERYRDAIHNIDEEMKKLKDAKDFAAAAGYISGAFSLIRAAGGGGGPAGILEGVGGLTSLAAKSQPQLAVVGALLSGIGGLIGQGQQQKVIISSYTEQAMAQMKEVRGDPLTTQVVLLGPDPRGMMYALARLARRDASPRFPGG